MVSDYFRLGDVVFRIDSEKGVHGDSAFRCEPTSCDLKVSVIEDSEFETKTAGKCYSEIIKQGNDVLVTVNPKQIGQLTEYNLFNAFDIPGVMLDRGQLVLHSSYIIHNGEAILFTGNSGIGKSTQAEFWRAERGAEVINGDRCLISLRNGKYYANGYINCGSSGICRNVTAPIKAVVILGQASANSVRKPGAIEAFKAILPQCAYDIKSAEQTEKAIVLISELISNVKVLRMNCVNAPSSVECLEKSL